MKSKLPRLETFVLLIPRLSLSGRPQQVTAWQSTCSRRAPVMLLPGIAPLYIPGAEVSRAGRHDEETGLHLPLSSDVRSAAEVMVVPSSLSSPQLSLIHLYLKLLSLYISQFPQVSTLESSLPRAK
jgi:hypothetical protein